MKVLILSLLAVVSLCFSNFLKADVIKGIPNSEGLYSDVGNGTLYKITQAYKNPATGTFILHGLSYIPFYAMGRLNGGYDEWFYGSPSIGFHQLDFASGEKLTSYEGRIINFDGRFLNDPRIGDHQPAGRMLFDESKGTVTVTTQGVEITYEKLNEPSTKLVINSIHNRVFETEANLQVNSLKLDRLLKVGGKRSGEYVAIVSPVNEPSLYQRDNHFRAFIGVPGRMIELPLADFARYLGPDESMHGGDLIKSYLNVDRSNDSTLPKITIAHALPSSLDPQVTGADSPYLEVDGEKIPLTPVKKESLSFVDFLGIPSLQVRLRTPADLVTRRTEVIQIEEDLAPGVSTSLTIASDIRSVEGSANPDRSGIGSQGGVCNVLLEGLLLSSK